MMVEREKNIEQYLVRRVKELGGRAYKFVSPGNNGVPDRIVILPGGKIFFAEMKAPGRKTTALQNMQIKRLKDLGQKVYVLDSRKSIDLCLGGGGE